MNDSKRAGQLTKASIKRWLPFIVLVSAALVFSAYLLISEGDSSYRPMTSDPKRIYIEACVQCHGNRGQGTGLLYPAFEPETMTLRSTKQAIRDGAFLMPAFKHIKGDTLHQLAEHVLRLGKKLSSSAPR